MEDADGLGGSWRIVAEVRSQPKFVVPVTTALGSTRHACFRAYASGLSYRPETENVVGICSDPKEVVGEPFGERSLTPASSPWQLRNQNEVRDFRFVGGHFVNVVVFLLTKVAIPREEVTTTAPRQPTATTLTALTARRSSGPFNRQNAALLKSIHVVVALHYEQAVRTQGKPLVYRKRNPVEDVGRITLVGVEDHSGFDIQTVDAPRRQIRRADVRDLSTAAVAKVDCLGVIIAVSVAHDSEMRVGTRQPENVDQLMHGRGLRFAVIGTNKDHGVEVFVCQTLERRAEHPENASFEEARLPSNPDDIFRQDVS